MNKKSKGSYTVEAVIVMTTILFIIFAIITAFMLLYQQTIMLYVASTSAQQGAVMWTNTSTDMKGENISTNNQGLYYRITEFAGGGGKNDKIQKIKSHAESQLQALSFAGFIGNATPVVDVKMNNNVLQRTIDVTISKKVTMPFEFLLNFFDKTPEIKVKCTALISEPAEYIRNIDYAMELANGIWSKVGPKFTGAIQKFLK